MGKILILSGLILVIIGLILHFAPWILNWFGKLPGDIRLNSKNMKVFIPITSMIIISVVLSILASLFKK